MGERVYFKTQRSLAALSNIEKLLDESISFDPENDECSWHGEERKKNNGNISYYIRAKRSIQNEILTKISELGDHLYIEGGYEFLENHIPLCKYCRGKLQARLKEAPTFDKEEMDELYGILLAADVAKGR